MRKTFGLIAMVFIFAAMSIEAMATGIASNRQCSGCVVTHTWQGRCGKIEERNMLRNPDGSFRKGQARWTCTSNEDGKYIPKLSCRTPLQPDINNQSLPKWTMKEGCSEIGDACEIEVRPEIGQPDPWMGEDYIIQKHSYCDQEVNQCVPCKGGNGNAF